MSEAATGGVLQEKLFLEILQNSQENTGARVSFLIKLQAFCYGCSFVAKLSRKKNFFSKKIFVFFTKYILFAEKNIFIRNKNFFSEKNFLYRKYRKYMCYK